MSQEIPPAIRTAIMEGRAILFLGAAASYQGLVKGKPVDITSAFVKSELCRRFLGNKFQDRSLMNVADFARNEDSLSGVQSFIRELFLPLAPANFHRIVPKFRWKAIVTTNYDLVVERAYQDEPKRLQALRPIYKNGDQLQKALSEQNSVPYLKLHGCIDFYSDLSVPMVLDSLEYSKFSSGRQHLVTAFKEWAIDSPIIFCGYSLADENIKQILFDIGDVSQNRKLYLYVSPKFEEVEIRYWSSRRIAPFAGTYEEFLRIADNSIQPDSRKLAALLTADALSISKWIPSNDLPGDALRQYLGGELVHVTPDAPANKSPSAKDFFEGLDNTFAPIYAEFDIKRPKGDELLDEVVLKTLNSTLPKFFVLQGYAGCGKSVLARRIAIEAARLVDVPLVVYLREGAVLRPSLLIELQQLIKSRLYLFIDDLFEFSESLPPFLETLREQNLPITVFANVRTNEFTFFGQRFSKQISKQFDVDDLDPDEINSLIRTLSKHKLLGPLESYGESERAIFVEKFYGRQLLVALHEITRGSPFEEIVVDEYEKITPRLAQQIYLDICTLHQCKVGARAGLLSRLNSIDIPLLNRYLDGPLAKVVGAIFDYRYKDYVFRSRHEEIARMVFDLAIPSPESRAEQLRRILSKMDLDYSSDNKAFFDLVKGRKLAFEFDSKRLANSVFDAAETASPATSYILHQRAILELNHKNGLMETANELLILAEAAARNEGKPDSTIQHTRANLLRKKANESKSRVEKDRFRADARAILKPQMGRHHSSHPENLYGQLLLDEIREAFDDERPAQFSSGTDIVSADPTVRLVNELHSLVESALRTRADDGQMILLKAEFLKVLGSSPKAIKVLEQYCQKNETQTSVIRVLGETLLGVNRTEDAIKVLKPALLNAGSDRQLNLTMAKALIKLNEDENHESILSHLRRSFTDGDGNYEARLLFGRCNMLYGDLIRGKAEFESLRSIYILGRDRVRARVLEQSGHPRQFIGKIQSKHSGFGFVTSNELRFQPFFSKSDGNPAWGKLAVGHTVTFKLGFSFRGPVAIELTGMDA